MTWYTKTYRIKETFVVVFSSGVELLLVSQLLFIFYSILTLLMGVFYGEYLKREMSTKITYGVLLVLSAIKNYFIFFVLASVLGVSLEVEGIEIYHQILSLFPGV